MKTKEQVDARKTKLGGDEAVELVGQVKEIFVAKGKKVVHVDLKKETPDRDALVKLLLGPTGNLRAPTHRSGNKLIVGFNAEMYEGLFE